MTKNRSKCLFILFAIILVICLVASFVNFTYPFTIGGNYYSYSNFVSNVKLGEDLSNSVRIIYRAELPESEAQSNYDVLKESTMSDLKKIVQDEGYRDVYVAEYGDDSIVIQVGNILDRDDESTVIDLIGSPATISFSMSTDTSEAFAGAKDIDSVSVYDYYDTTTGETSYYVRILFKEEMIDDIAEATSDGGTLYIYFGDTQFTQMSLDSNSDGTTGITNGEIYIQSDAFVDHATANSYANKIKTGMLGLELTQTDCALVTPSYGVGAGVLLCAAIAVFVLIAFIFMVVKYKHIGWVACFNLLFFITLSLFFLQSIPIVHMNFAGMIGFIIAFIIATEGMVTIFEKAKAHYQADTKLYISFKVAQKESLTRIFVTNVLMLLLGFACLFMPNMAIQSFGWVVFVMSFISVFTNLVLMRLFIKMYLPFNSTDGKKCNFHKGGKNA